MAGRDDALDGSSPGESTGRAAEAARATEAQLAQRLSDSAELDRQLVDAMLFAHRTTVRGRQRLDRLETEIVNAARTWDLGTPVGEREFQRFLTARLGDIIDVVEDAGGDATTGARLVMALTAQYGAPVGSGELEPTADASPPAGEPDLDTGLEEAPFGDLPEDELLDGDPFDGDPFDAAPPPAPAAAPWRGAPAMPELSGMPGFGSEMPGLGALSGGGQGLPLGLLSGLRGAEELPDDGLATDATPAPDDAPAAPEDADADPAPDAPPDDHTAVRLPDGTTTTVTDPELAAAMQAVADGTPVAEAFARQGIDVPPPGTAVSAPVDPARLQAGDIGVFTDRHALAVGDGRALLDGQFQDVSNLRGPGFLGWLHPRGSADPAPEPEPTRPAAAEQIARTGG